MLMCLDCLFAFFVCVLGRLVGFVDCLFGWLVVCHCTCLWLLAWSLARLLVCMFLCLCVCVCLYVCVCV